MFIVNAIWLCPRVCITVRGEAPEGEQERTRSEGTAKRPGGFWVAAANRAAGYEAITGIRPVDDVASVALLNTGPVAWSTASA